MGSAGTAFGLGGGMTLAPRLRALARCAECGGVLLGEEDGGTRRAARVTEIRTAPRGVRMQRRTLYFHPACLEARRAWHRRRATLQLGFTMIGAAALAVLTWALHLSPLVPLPIALLGAYAAALEWRDVSDAD